MDYIAGGTAASSKTRNKVCAYDKMCAYTKGALNNPSPRYTSYDSVAHTIREIVLSANIVGQTPMNHAAVKGQQSC